MVGGFEFARTGDLGKGLMAGLGAYGGAGLASSALAAAAPAQTTLRYGQAGSWHAGVYDTASPAR